MDLTLKNWNGWIVSIGQEIAYNFWMGQVLKIQISFQALF